MRRLGPILLLFCFISVRAAEMEIFQKAEPVKIVSATDRLLAADWRKRGVPLPRQASDAVFCRRVYLSLCGRIPTPEEVKNFLADPALDKREKLVDALLASPDYPEYFTMLWCDMLRVKSEFPINLWPNAVYVYQRRILRFLRENEPCDHFAGELLMAGGSNFSDPEVNFYRAVSDKRPPALAAAVALSFLGRRFEKMSKTEQQNLTAFFANIRFKSTREWKEELLTVKPDEQPVKLIRPDGMEVIVSPGEDRRKLFCDYLFERERLPEWKKKVRRLTGNGIFHESDDAFALAMVNRVWFWILGRGLVEEPDDLRCDNPAVNPELLRDLARRFADGGYDFRQLCREIVLSAAGQASPIPGGDTPAVRQAAQLSFAAYPVRKLHAEVLADAIASISSSENRYSSVIPEPFSFIPGGNRSVTLADGSISSSFLTLFGRPARDSGKLAERNVHFTPEQRLWSFNSGELLRRSFRVFRHPTVKKEKNFTARIQAIYLLILSRYASEAEEQLLKAEFQRRRGGERARLHQHLAWVLLNSFEFLTLH